MRSELSEFSYGFAITAELRDFFRPWVVEPPVFPTLRQEAQLGWDVKFPVTGRSLFLQFKVADALTTQNAGEWHYYQAEYFRFLLHRISRSDQHNRLRSLAVTEPFVFYVAPRFYRLAEFTECYSHSLVSDQSAWVALSSLPGITDDRQHHITYRTGSDVRFASPESTPVEKAFDGRGLKAYVVREWEARKRTMTIEDFTELRSSLLGIVERSQTRMPALPATTAGNQVLQDVAFISRTFFGAEFLFVHEPQ